MLQPGILPVQVKGKYMFSNWFQQNTEGNASWVWKPLVPAAGREINGDITWSLLVKEGDWTLLRNY